MDRLLEVAGAWLAKACAIYGLAFLLIPAFCFVHIALLAAVVWDVGRRSRHNIAGVEARGPLRRWMRLGIEMTFGLINPVFYLAILSPAIPALRPAPGSWHAWLQTGAWILLTAFWVFRLFGGALDSRPPAVRVLLGISLALVAVYAIKDARVAFAQSVSWTQVLNVAKLSPFYLIPVVLLWAYWRAAESRGCVGGLFLLPGRAARLGVACTAGALLVTIALAAQRRSDGAVRELVAEQREFIVAAGARYGVDPKVIASIVYVTHRDQLSPFRDQFERLVISGWSLNLREEFGLRSPDRAEELGMDESPALHRALDISVGVAQIKPRTALTASVLAMGTTPDDLPKPAFYYYRDVEPIGEGWVMPAAARAVMPSPIPVPAERRMVTKALLDERANLALCALILALYQKQWEALNPEWSLRGRPEILATLYQTGFARSKPHGAPRSNAFGARVLEVYKQAWMEQLIAGAPTRG